ncbi:MAG: SBBP repeat-containing protein, partial [Candidatus Omnitrophica bacterium]|nr:SBBP repeat-containing protein [Candidatus Omnitrophota bacterium]
MKRSISLLAVGIFLACSFNVRGQAPNCLWVQSASGTGDDLGINITVDGAGNCYVTGSFAGEAAICGSSLVSTGQRDIFIAKHNCVGGLQWVKQAGGAGNDQGFGIAVDSGGNCYVTGEFQGQAAFGNIHLASAGGSDVFLAKLDDAGEVLWVQQAGGIGDDWGQSVTVDATGNCYITGRFAVAASFGNNFLEGSSAASFFIAKYNPDGVLQWVRGAGGTGNVWGQSIAVDASGESFVIGRFEGIARFNNTSLTSAGEGDVFIARFNPDGAMQWVQQAGGLGDDWGEGIAVDASGTYCVVTGWFQDIG